MKTKELFLTVRVLISSEKSMDSLEDLKNGLIVAVNTSKHGSHLNVQEVELTDVEDKDEDQSDEVKRQIQIMRIENCVRNNGGSIDLGSTDFTLSFEGVLVVTVYVGYISDKNDDDFDFEEMGDDEIDELHGIIEQIELMDDKTMRRTEN